MRSFERHKYVAMLALVLCEPRLNTSSQYFIKVRSQIDAQQVRRQRNKLLRRIAAHNKAGQKPHFANSHGNTRNIGKVGTTYQNVYHV